MISFILPPNEYGCVYARTTLGKIDEEDIGNIWFQQDGATSHTAEATLDVLRIVFDNYFHPSAERI